MPAQVSRLVPPFGAITIHRIVQGLDALLRRAAARRAERATRKQLERLSSYQLSDIGIDRDLRRYPDRLVSR